jgi:hypothetical protein
MHRKPGRITRAHVRIAAALATVVTVAGLALGITSQAGATTHHHTHPLPAWVHWRTGGHHDGPCVVVWGKPRHGKGKGSSAVVCESGYGSGS